MRQDPDLLRDIDLGRRQGGKQGEDPQKKQNESK